MSDYEIIITSGRGPDEVRVFVAKLAERIVAQCNRFGLCVLSETTHGPEDAPFSVSVRVAGAVPILLREEWGTHSLLMHSVERGRRARKRWHAGVACCEASVESRLLAGAVDPIDARDLAIQPCRAGGPGGQHVNKTSSAVMVLHKPSGIRVRADSQRSQSQNRREAVRRIAATLAGRERDVAARRKGEKRSLHHRLERGSTVRTYRLDHEGKLKEEHAI